MTNEVLYMLWYVNFVVGYVVVLMGIANPCYGIAVQDGDIYPTIAVEAIHLSLVTMFHATSL